MVGDWRNVVQVLLDSPVVMQLMVPLTGPRAAGYGLIHTMCTKDTPDWLTDHVAPDAHGDFVSHL